DFSTPRDRSFRRRRRPARAGGRRTIWRRPCPKDRRRRRYGTTPRRWTTRPRRDVGSLQSFDHAAPAGAVSEGAVNEDDGHGSVGGVRVGHGGSFLRWAGRTVPGAGRAAHPPGIFGVRP